METIMNQFIKRIFFLMCLLITLTTAADVFKTAAAAGRPIIVVDEMDYDFSEVFEGTEVTHDFLVRNTGTAQLLIKDIKTGCSCTTASFTRRIPPGGVGSVSIKLRTRGYGGHGVYQTAHLYTNDPKNPLIALSMSGTNDPKFN